MLFYIVLSLVVLPKCKEFSPFLQWGKLTEFQQAAQIMKSQHLMEGSVAAMGFIPDKERSWQ